MGEKKFIQFPFTGGLAQKTEQAYLDPSAKLLNITNGNYTKVGAIDKRYGMESLSNNVIPPNELPTPTQGQRIVSWNRSDLTVMGSSGLYTWSAAESKLAGVSNLPPCYPLRRPISVASGNIPPQVFDIPYNGRTLRIATSYDLSFNLYGSVYDADTGDIILDPTEIVPYAGNEPVVINGLYLQNTAASNRALLIINYDTSAAIYGVFYDPTINAFTTPTVIVSSGAVVADAYAYVNDPYGNFVLAYGSIGGSTITTTIYSPTFSVIATNTTTLASFNTLLYPINVVATYGEQIWVTFITSDSAISANKVWVIQFSGDESLTVGYGPLSIATPSAGLTLFGSGRINATEQLVITYQRVNPGGSSGINTFGCDWIKVTNAGSAVNNGTVPIGFYPFMRPFQVGGVPYMVFVYYNMVLSGTTSYQKQSAQVTMYLMEWYSTTGTPAPLTTVRPVATVAKNVVSMQDFSTILAGGGGRRPTMSQYLSNATRFACGLNTVGIDDAAVSGIVNTSYTAEFFFDTAHTSQLYVSQELGSELHLSGGVPFVFDATIACEDNFFFFPEWSYVTTAGTGTPLESGKYIYAVCYAYTDGAGLIHRSAPAYTNQIPITNGGAGPVLTITALSSTWRDLVVPGQTVAEVYRTVADGSIFYLVDRISVSNTTNPTITWPATGEDTTTSANLQSSTTIYTTGGVLPNINPPTFIMQTTYNGRVAGVDETLSQVWFSQAFSPGTAPGFSGSLVVPFSEGGDITAIASMDDKFIVFKEATIWVMYGNNGPALTGQNSDWSVPQRIQSNVGAISQFGTCSTDVGIFFQSQAGIYLMGRDLAVSFIGAPVIDVITANPVITSATIVPGFTQVRFTCNNGAGGSTTTVCYDYLLQEWTTHTYQYITNPVQSSCLSYDPMVIDPAIMGVTRG